MPCDGGGGVRVTASSCRWSGDGYRRRRRTGEPCARLAQSHVVFTVSAEFASRLLCYRVPLKRTGVRKRVHEQLLLYHTAKHGGEGRGVGSWRSDGGCCCCCSHYTENWEDKGIYFICPSKI